MGMSEDWAFSVPGRTQSIDNRLVRRNMVFIENIKGQNYRKDTPGKWTIL
jgi:hypothetical protein